MQPQPSKPRHGGHRQGAGRKPAYGEPTKTVRVPQSAVPSVVEFLNALRKASSLVPASGSGLQLRPIASPRTPTTVPALGRRVRAGKPTSGDDYQEDAVDLGRHLVRDPASTFVMKVEGWSMRDAGIADGDELVVDRNMPPEDGRIVVAAVDGELTIKRLKQMSDGWLLQAENPDFADVRVGTKNDLLIWGVVTRVLHKP